MNGKFVLRAAVAAIVGASLCACGFAVAGCDDGGEATRSVVSYVSSDRSQTYSSTADVVEAVADSVVEITTESVTTQWGMQYIVSGAGSGVIVGEGDDGTYSIITNHHVIDGANDIMVRMRNGEEFDAELVASDDSADIAVITIECDEQLTMATWGDSDSLRVGEDLIAIGNPLGSLGGTVTKGILSATDRTIVVEDYPMTLLQTDTAINPGNSGGGLFNMRGELIGIVNAKTSDEEVEGICFAIPANDARKAYDDLLTYGYIEGRAAFPIEVTEGSITSGINSSQSVVYVTFVGGNVAEDTFKQYDRIYKIGDEKITTLASYNQALASLTPGEEVTVEVYRGRVQGGFFGSSISFDDEPTTFTVTPVQYGAN